MDWYYTWPRFNQTESGDFGDCGNCGDASEYGDTGLSDLDWKFWSDGEQTEYQLLYSCSCRKGPVKSDHFDSMHV